MRRVLSTSSNGKYSVSSLVAMSPAAQVSAFLPTLVGIFENISGAMFVSFFNSPASRRDRLLYAGHRLSASWCLTFTQRSSRLPYLQVYRILSP